MPPPGVPDWVFPGAVVNAVENAQQGCIITGIHLTRRDDSPYGISLLPYPYNPQAVSYDVSLEELLERWVHMGQYDTIQNVNGAHYPETLVGNYYSRRTVDPELIMLIRVDRIEGSDAIIEIGASEVDERLPLSVFESDLLAGLIRALPYEGRFFLPDHIPELQPGAVLLDEQDREVFVIGWSFSPPRGGWLCRATHDLGMEDPNEYLRRARHLAGALPAEPDNLGETFEERMHNAMQQPHARPLRLERYRLPPAQLVIPESYQPENPTRWVHTIQEAMVTMPLTTFPLRGFQITPASTGGIRVFSIGDRWQLPSPHEGMWTLISMTTVYTTLEGEQHTLIFQHDGTEERHSFERGWVISNGLRISPPDPRHQGLSVDVDQIWEIPSTLTRQREHMWRVTAIMPNRMVTLSPAGSGGAPITWHEIQLRAQGAYVRNGRVRRTALERLMEEDDVG